MKTILISASTLLLTFFLAVNTLTAQCHFNLLYIRNQTEVDSFKINNPDCNKISGLIIFDGAGIENLDGLQHIDTMAGTFVFLNCLNLINLSGLSNLKYIEQLEITGPTIYTNFAGLNNLTQISQGLSLNYISNLLSFEGLTNLEYINGVSIMYSNLTSLDELNNIDSISSLSVQFSDKLVNIHLENFTNNYQMNIRDNRTLEYVNINNADKKANNISLVNNPLLWSITGFENLDSVGSDRGGLVLINSPLLSNLEAFNNVTYFKNLKLVNSQVDSLTFNALAIIEDSLLIKDNALLSYCSIAPVCDKVLNDGKARIQNNKSNCETREKVKENCMLISISSKNLNNNISIYPNPSDGILYFEGRNLKWNTKVKIVDLNGKVIMSNQLGAIPQINLSGLSRGVYFVHVVKENGRFTEKVIVN